MIIELVLFKNPPGLSRADELAGARSVAARWLANADLIAKHFIRSEDGFGGAVYLWPSRAAAEAAHDEAWRQAVIARTGSLPEIRYFDLLMSVDNQAGAVTEYPEA